MTEIKIGYRAMFYGGNTITAVGSIKETYEEAAQEIERENENINDYNSTHFNTVNPWTHAQIEKVYYRH